MVILLTVVILLAFILILIATFTYVVTYSSNDKIAAEYYNDTNGQPVQDLIDDYQKYAEEARNNPFMESAPLLDRDDLIEFMEKEVREKREEASRKTKETAETTSIITQLEEIFGKEESLAG